MKRWRREARRFLRHHGAELATRPFWIFSSSPSPVIPSATTRAGSNRAGVVEARRSYFGVRGHVVFGGRVPLDPRRAPHSAGW